MNAYAYAGTTLLAGTVPNHDQFYHSMLVKVGVDFFRIRPYFFVIANQQLHSNVTISLPIDIYK